MSSLSSIVTPILLAVLVLGLNAAPILAAEVLVTPPLFDLEVAPRDVITKEVTLTNTTDHKLDVFATVNEIAVDEGGSIKEFVSPVMTDQTITVTSWIEVTRGVIELEPHGTTTIPVTLRVHQNAAPRTYHAFIGFVSTSNRPEAEARALQGGESGVVLKAVLQEKKNELLRIASFAIDRFVLFEQNRQVTVEVQNGGDDTSVVQGEVIFYNSRGEEVGSARVNDEGSSIAPKETAQYTVTIPFHDKLGRFKANVKLEYGEEKKSLLFDTTQFFMIPLMVLIALGGSIVLVSLVVTYLLRRMFYVELHDEDEGSQLPLYVRTDREHETKDHDIHISKTE